MKKELKLLKLALIDYEKGHEVAKENHTNFGFCYYFESLHNVNLYKARMEKKMPNLYKQRKTNSNYHYQEDGNTLQGNADRVEALRNAIKELEG